MPAVRAPQAYLIHQGEGATEFALLAAEALRGAAEARVTELEVEIAQLKLDLEAATAPKA